MTGPRWRARMSVGGSEALGPNLDVSATDLDLSGGRAHYVVGSRVVPDSDRVGVRPRARARAGFAGVGHVYLEAPVSSEAIRNAGGAIDSRHIGLPGEGRFANLRRGRH